MIFLCVSIFSLTVRPAFFFTFDVAGGALALQAGLSFPHTLAGICSVAGWLSSGMPAAEAAERWEMPILMCHGFDDSMVPIEVARSSCALDLNLT